MKNKFTLSFALLLFVFSAAKLNAQTAKIQIVHNSPDYIIDTVDVWCDTVKIANDLVFRKATQLITVDSGYHVITISKKFSTDSSALYSLLKVDSFRVDTSQRYLAFITGVVDTNTYATNPAGIDRSLSFVAMDSYKTTGLATQVDLSFFNGTPDAPQWDLNEIGLPGLTKIADDIAYNSFSPATLMPGVNTLFNITSADSSSILAAYRLNMLLTGYKGNTACIFSSGVLPSLSNPALAAANKFYVVLNTGNVVALTALMSDVQFVHNSADVTNDSLDIYINGTLALDNFAFRTASPFLNQKAYTAFSVAIAPQTSASVAEAFYTTNMTLDSNVSYYLIAHGVKVAAQYVANPNGKNIAFKVTSYKGVRKIASAPKNVDLLYFHSSTDLQTTTCRGEAQSQFLSKDDSYGAFHGYGAHTSLDNITMQLRDAVADTVMYTGTADLASHQGETGLVFTSGFLHSNATTNQNGDTLIMFVAWNDGNVDSIAVKAPQTGLSERVLANSRVSVFPNPANNQFTVQLTTQKSSEVSYTVTDITGRTIVTETYTKLSAGANMITVDAGTFATGIYFVTLRSSGETITQKVSIVK